MDHPPPSSVEFNNVLGLRFSLRLKLTEPKALSILSNKYSILIEFFIIVIKKKLHGLSPRANYTDRATAACRRSDCQLLRIDGATWSA
jgi:hypothetical protein